MAYESTDSPAFLESVKTWLAENGEVLVLVRFSHAAGNQVFEFFTSFPAFEERIAQLRPMTCITVFREKQLPLRGSIDETFVEAALALVPDGKEYLIAGLDRIHCGPASWIPEWAGETHTEMREHLEDNRGARVAFGIYPPWLEDDGVVSAVVPQDDGTVVCGVY